MKTKVYKIELYVTAFNDNTLENIAHELHRIDDAGVCVGDAEEIEVDWHDEIDINYTDKQLAAYRKLFKD